MDCRNWLSLPGRERDLAAPARTWTRTQPGTGCVCLCLSPLGTAGSLITPFEEVT